MDGFTEKKWFVYLGDHHEGPFSLSEIQAKMGHGQLSATNYVWAEGMADWTLMTEVQAFESIVASPAPAAPAFNGGPSLAASGAPSGFSAISVEPLEIASGPILSAANEAPAVALEEPAPPTSEEAPTQLGIEHSPPRRTFAGRLIKIGFLFMILGAIGYAYNAGYLTQSMIQDVMSAADPILSKLGISSIPKLDDVSPEEYAQLKAAARASLDQPGPQIAIALSKSDLINPTFYVASNLPDGAVLQIYLSGVPETLLNQLSFSAMTQATITKKFGKTLPLRFPQGRGLPRGQYNLYIVDPGTQPAAVTPLISRMPIVAQTESLPPSVPKGLRVIGTQSYFLGGARDATYTARLKEFHDKVAAHAQEELMELQQIAMTLDSQLTETNQKFAALSRSRNKLKKPTPSQKRAWAQYHAKWDKMSQQLGQLFSKLTPEALENDYFYGSLYQMSKETSDSLNQLHSLQTSYFTAGAAGSGTDPKAFGIQLGETQASAKTAVDLLKAKIDQTQKLPPGPSGLPQR